jgi:DNA replication protein DnaC
VGTVDKSRFRSIPAIIAVSVALALAGFHLLTALYGTLSPMIQRFVHLFVACALAHSACRHGFSARYYRMQRLLSELAIARGDGSYPKMLMRLSKLRLLILDDWRTAQLSPAESRDILEIIDDRSQLSSTIIASQLPVEDWHASIIDPTVADAVLSRLVHNSHRIPLKRESMRKAEQR